MEKLACFKSTDGVYIGEWTEAPSRKEGDGEGEEQPEGKTKKDSAREDAEEVASAVRKVKHGFGILELSDRGQKYEGMWQLDEMQGQGKMIYSEAGESYEGDFMHSQYHGFGRYTWADGCSYEGEFNRGKVGRSMF